MRRKAAQCVVVVFLIGFAIGGVGGVGGVSPVGLAGPAAAQEGATIPAAKLAKIRAVLRMTGASKLGVQVVDQMMPMFKQSAPGVPDSFWQEFRAGVKEQELEDLVVPVYARHFNEAELQGLIEFYSSPLGKKVIAETPALMQESMAAGAEWGRALGQRALARAKEKGYQVKG